MNINGKEWRMVPVEPTPEMCKAVSDYGSTRYIYGEMLAAAPPPPVVEVTDEDMRIAERLLGFPSALKEIAALRARVAELEATLREARD